MKLSHGLGSAHSPGAVSLATQRFLLFPRFLCRFRAINLLLFLPSISLIFFLFLFFLRSLSSAFASFCQSIGSQSHSLVYFSRGNPLTRPRSRPSCLWREMGRRSYCGSATSSPASGEWRNKLEASRLSCGEAMDDEETVFNETHYIYCV